MMIWLEYRLSEHMGPNRITFFYQTKKEILCITTQPFRMYFVHTLTKKSLATLDGEFVYPEITIKIRMHDVLKVCDVQI